MSTTDTIGTLVAERDTALAEVAHLRETIAALTAHDLALTACVRLHLPRRLAVVLAALIGVSRQGTTTYAALAAALEHAGLVSDHEALKVAISQLRRRVPGLAGNLVNVRSIGYHVPDEVRARVRDMLTREPHTTLRGTP